MFDIAPFVEIQRLIAAVERLGARLAPAEREVLGELAAKYVEPVAVDATDRTCLEVILRNVEIRKAYGADPERDTGRVIEFERKGGDK
ncbi:MAG: hypothetical protein ACE5H8_09515 [Alphaproteobacteria bacterium]